MAHSQAGDGQQASHKLFLGGQEESEPRGGGWRGLERDGMRAMLPVDVEKKIHSPSHYSFKT